MYRKHINNDLANSCVIYVKTKYSVIIIDISKDVKLKILR